MVDTPNKKPANADDKASLGINRGIYALGNSVKAGLIGGTIATIATVAVIAVGRGKVSFITKAAESIDRFHGWIKEGIKGAFVTAKGKVGLQRMEITGPTLVTAGAVGWLVGHIAQVPSSVRGWKKAQRAQNLYAGVVEDKERLIEANAELISENQRYKAELENKNSVAASDAPENDAPGKSFVENLKKERPEAEASTHAGKVIQMDEKPAQAIRA